MAAPKKTPYYIELDSLAIPKAGGIAVVPAIQIPNNFGVVMFMLTGQVFQAGTATPVEPPDLLVSFKSTSLGTDYFSGPVPLRNIIGTAELPAVPPIPFSWPGGSSIQFSLVNDDPTYAYDAHITLIGIADYENPNLVSAG